MIREGMWADVKISPHIIFIVLSSFSAKPSVHVPQLRYWKVKDVGQGKGTFRTPASSLSGPSGFLCLS